MDWEPSFLARIRAGDAQAFEAIVARYGERMLAAAHRFLPNDADSADAVQDAFFAAYRSIASFKGDSTLWTWLYRVLINACLTIRRSRYRRRVVSFHDLSLGMGKHGRPAIPGWRGTESASSRLEQAEVQAHVRNCIQRLPPRYREVLLLRDIERLNTDQTAQRLGTPRSTVKTRLHRARQALRVQLEPLRDTQT